MARPKSKTVKIEIWADMSAASAHDLKRHLKEVVETNLVPGDKLTYLAIDITDRG